MRKTLLFGAIAFLALSAALGERYFNRAVGQDIPLPKASELEKKDLFDLLKKDLEAKKDTPTFPPLKKDSEAKKDAPAFPPLSSAQKSEPTTLPIPAGSEVSPLPLPSAPQKDAGQPAPPSLQSEVPTFPSAPPQGSPRIPSNPAPERIGSPKANTSNSANPPPIILPSNSNPFQSSGTTIPAGHEAAKPSSAPKAVALPKNSPWSLSVVMVDGQTIVTAIVNKKHEFKILCQTLDLQTGKGTLKATGKVQINGDALNGTCDHLVISLLEDRLLLEGKALVSIDRSAANVSDANASFELKGETLNLRISELPSASVTVSERTVTSRSDTPSRVVAASLKLDGTQWTPYGRLRAMKSSENMWRLENNDGAVMAYLLAREGGSLERYVDQSISVYGTYEREHAGQPVLRVTHIALP